MRPLTYGFAEWFNSRIEEIPRSQLLRSGRALKQRSLRHARFLNDQLPQYLLNARTLIGILAGSHRKKPDLIQERPYSDKGSDM